ncbi:MAG: FMN-binding protein [Verrucomicrobia bacterium]|nr:FMN-binding protein [Verrucomicrobiota bacterium]
MKPLALQLYRLAVVAVIAWLIRDLAVRQRTQGDSPIVVDEVKSFFADAASLRPDSSARDGLFILDRAGRELGYVVRTQPQCHDIVGYAGVTDALVVLDREWKIVGLKIHASEDGADYVRSIATDRRFLKKWNSLTWDAAADLDLKQAGIEGVSGATMTSMAIARSVKARLQLAKDELIARPALRLGWRDAGLFVVVGLAALLAFGPATWRHRWKRPWQIALIVYVGFIAGDFVSVKLVAGWARSGVQWTTLPGLALLTTAALLVPWTTRQPFYCHHLCPHGAAQELLWQFRHRLGQSKPLTGERRGSRASNSLPQPLLPPRPPVKPPESKPPRALVLRADVIRALESLPYGFLLLARIIAALVLPLDLAGVEPFAAYIFRTAGVATLVIAGVGLVASWFVPQAYCRFGCPTGALLNFVRTRGTTDRFSTRDAAALAFVALAAALNHYYLPILHWVKGV